MTTPNERPDATGLRNLPLDRQRSVAVWLAEVVEALGDLAPLTPEPLSVFADKIRNATDADQAAMAATLLREIPALQQDEEPEGPAWFALGAVVAWIYAAEAQSDTQGKRVVDTLSRVEDMLDYAEDRLGIGGLCDQLHGAVAGVMHGDEAALLAMKDLGRGLVGPLRDIA